MRMNVSLGIAVAAAMVAVLGTPSFAWAAPTDESCWQGMMWGGGWYGMFLGPLMIIVFIALADVAGYSRLMGDDEAGTRARFGHEAYALVVADGLDIAPGALRQDTPRYTLRLRLVCLGDRFTSVRVGRRRSDYTEFLLDPVFPTGRMVAASYE